MDFDGIDEGDGRGARGGVRCGGVADRKVRE